ncbi:MAG: DUF4405 domain-containing protein [Ignavibacteriota bacterium]
MIATANKPVAARLKIAFALDVALLLAICALEQIPFTGATAHEWLGLAFAALVVWHLLLSWAWISSQTRQFFRPASVRAVINYLLNLAFFALLTAVVWSGIMISQEAIPTFTGPGPRIGADSPWLYVHDKGSDLIVILAGLHLALNWDWALAAGRRLAGRPRTDAT